MARIMKLIPFLLLLNCMFFNSVFSQEIPFYIPSHGLVGWWPFNGNTDDESLNGNSGINHGCELTTDRFGIENSAYYFDGIYNYIEVEIQNNSLQLKNNFTISVWANIKFNPNNNQVLISKGDKSSNEYVLGCSNEGYLFINNNNAPAAGLVNFKNHFNNWTNIIYVFKNGLVLLYINGKQIASYPVIEPILPSSLSLIFGALFGIGTNTPVKGSYFNGELDDIAIWNIDLDENEIKNVYSSGE